MGYFIITDKQWAMLRDEILALAQTSIRHLENRVSTQSGCTMVMCVGYWASASAPYSITEIRACCRLHKSDTSAIISMKMWSGCYRQNQRKPRATNRQTMKRWKQLEI